MNDFGMIFFFLDKIIYIIIGLAILGAIIKFLFWVWVGKKAYRAVIDYTNFYNASVEAQLINLARAVHAQQNQHILEYQRAARRQIARLPRQEKASYKAKLADVETGKLQLNPATGEWE